MIKAAKERNDALIRAILEKEKTLCPGAVALIGIYGSFLTGDIQPLSDLDLLILIGDERGWQLGTTFIQDDVGIGHDIYCTSWESLREDARYEHPHISKLMDSKIVYCADQKHMDQLEALRTEVRKKLEEPFGEEDYQKARRDLSSCETVRIKAPLPYGDFRNGSSHRNPSRAQEARGRIRILCAGTPGRKSFCAARAFSKASVTDKSNMRDKQGLHELL